MAKKQQRLKFKPCLPFIVMGNVRSLADNKDELTALAQSQREYRECSLMETQQDITADSASITGFQGSRSSHCSLSSVEPAHLKEEPAHLKEEPAHLKEEPAHLKEEPEPCIKQEPQEFPFHMVTVKTEDDEDKSSVLHQRPTEENREETNGWDCGAEAGCSSDPLTQFHSDSEEEEHTDSSEDTDHSEDYSQEQAPAKRSYAMIPPDATVRDERRHSCPECGKRFKNKSNLKRHILTHTGEKPHKCSVCETCFTEKGKLRKHLRFHHHMCTVCEACFPSDMNLKKHLMIHIEDGTVDQSILKLYKFSDCRKYSCPECGKNFRQKSHLQEHSLIHSGEKPYQCLECGIKLRRKPDLKRHMLSHTGEEPHKCSVCEKSFIEKSLVHHLKIQHHMCTVCEVCFSDKMSLKEHLKTRIEGGTVEPLIFKSYRFSYHRPHSCPECGKRFTKESGVKRHMLHHTGEKPHKCSVCETRFTIKCNLRKHLRNKHHMCTVCEVCFPSAMNLKKHLMIHRKDGSVDQSILKLYKFSDCRKYSCPECGKNFGQKSHLQEHAIIHSGEKPYECPECAMKFRRKPDLKRHILSHTGEKPHQCSVCENSYVEKRNLTDHLRTKHHMCTVCDVSFSDKMSLKEHLQTHIEDGTVDSSILKSYRFSDERPYSCSECAKSFMGNSDLKKHMLVHSEERPHKCSDCDKCFKDKCALKTHTRIHKAEKPHVCSVCNKGFPLKCDLNRHRKHVHPKCPVCGEQFLNNIKLKEHLNSHEEDQTVEQTFRLRKSEYNPNKVKRMNPNKIHNTKTTQKIGIS